MDGSAFWEFAKVVIGAGLGSGVTSIGLAWWKHRGDSRYLAMRLAVTLEKFASDCSSLIFANKNAEPERGHELPEWETGLPKLEEYPSDADGWKAIASDLAADCLNFRNRIFESQSSIYAEIEHCQYDTEREVRRRASQMGLEAWHLALRLRSAAGLKPIALVFDYASHLVEAKAQSDADAAAAAEFSRQVFGTGE